MSSDPADLSVLTPGHFLIGSALNALPDVKLDDKNLSLHNRWQRVQHATQTFWSRWSKEYLLGLQKRNKWRTPNKLASINDLVLLVDENTPTFQWAIGRVTALHPGKDGHTRVATVHTAKGDFSRALNKLCFLPKSENSN